MIPGTLATSHNVGFYPYKGRQYLAKEFKIVNGYVLEKGQLPSKADEVGYDEFGSYYCGVIYMRKPGNNYCFGKVKDGYITFCHGGIEIKSKEFQYIQVMEIDGKPAGSGLFNLDSKVSEP